MVRDGRRAALTPAGRSYHELIMQGFGRLVVAQDYIHAHRQAEQLTISGFPTLMQRFASSEVKFCLWPGKNLHDCCLGFWKPSWNDFWKPH